MLLKRLEIRNCRKIRQADIEFHGPGLKVIQGMNESGKTTIAQSIAITFAGPKEVVPGMISRGEEQAEIIAYTDNELKIRTVIQGTVKQTVSQKDKTTGRYVNMSGGVRAFLDSLRSGLEMPWAMRDFTDTKIIEILKERCGITKKIDEIDAAIKNKEIARTETGRDIKRFGTLDPVEEAKHPEPVDKIKKEKEESRKYQQAYAAAHNVAVEAVRKKLSLTYTFEELENLIPIIKNLVKEGRTQIDGFKAYTKEDIEALDEQIAQWYETEEKARKYDEYFAKKEQLDKLNAAYEALTAEIETLRENRKKTLSEMKLGVKGLTIGEDNFLYHNDNVRGVTDTNKTGNWSTAESIKVFFSIGATFCGDLKVLVVDNAESLDEKATKVISDWAESAQFLVILLKVASVPQELEEGVIYIREGEVITK